MALSAKSGLETATFVLTKEQVRRMRLIVQERSSDHKRVTLSDVAREVVAAGLMVISHVDNIGSSASAQSAEAA